MGVASEIGKAFMAIVPKLDKDTMAQQCHQIETDLSKAGGNAGSGFLGSFGGMVKGLATSAAVVGAAKAVGSAFSACISEYADYEQLVGGVETLFGAGGKSVEQYAESVGKSVSEVQSEYDSLMQAQDMVMSNAANAFQTAGMSANEYMEMATSTAASMVSSLGGDTLEAARLTDMAITDMSDNANKMGTDMEAVQNAYNGFAKGNFTMLDNLKLGYGGTQAEMERLLADAQALSGVEYDISSYSDIAEAIHVVQVEMGMSGITMAEFTELVKSGAMTYDEALELLGTTAKEAQETISGSFGMLSSSWQNLVTGFANGDADMSQLVDNVAMSASAVLRNIIPAVTNILSNIGSVFTDADFAGSFDLVFDAVKDKAPDLIEAVMGLIGQARMAVIQGIPDIADAVLGALPSILREIPSIASGIAGGIMEAAPVVLGVIGDVASSVTDILPEIVDAAMDAVSGLFDMFASGAPEMIGAAASMADGFVSSFADRLPDVLSTVVDVATDLVAMVADSAPDLIDAASSAVSDLAASIEDSLPEIIDSASGAVSGILDMIVENGPELIQAVLDGIVSLSSSLIDMLPTIIESARHLFMGLIDGIIEALPDILAYIPVLVQSLCDMLITLMPQIVTAGFELLSSLVSDMPAILSAIGEAVLTIGPAIVETIGSLLGTMVQAGIDLMSGLVQGIMDGAGMVLEAIGGVVGDAIDWAKGLLGIHSPSTVFAEIGGYTIAGMTQGILGGRSAAVDAMDSVVRDITGRASGMTATLSLSARTSSFGGSGLGMSLGDRGIGGSVADALRGMSVNIDGRKMVGAIGDGMGGYLGRSARLGGIA